jgi:acetylornithine deacetylase/succinyl-diaminopimelate desuccinylase-like protein
MLCVFFAVNTEARAVNQDHIESFVKDAWKWEEKSVIVKALHDFIAIPNTSPDFDPEWSKNGHTDRAIDLLVETITELKAQWGRQGCKVDDITIEVLGHKDRPETDEAGHRRTPLIYIDIPAFGSDAPGSSVLLYGHMDKQPEMLPWREGLGPHTPVLKDGRLYGRGGADDGYAVFSAFTAVMALRAQQASHARSVIIVEAREESDSADLPYYIRKQQERIGPVSLIICLDSGSGNYDQLWLTTSLRGIVNAWLEVKVLSEGVHSGISSGIVPSSFRIARQLLSRLEDENTGEIRPSWLKVDIPKEIRAQAAKTAKILGQRVYNEFPFVNDKVQPAAGDMTELLLNNTWRSQLAVTGSQGLPTTPESAGNVMLPHTRLKISLRLPPTLDAKEAAKAVSNELTRDPPYNAVVTVSDLSADSGWAAPPLAPWLDKANREASLRFFRANPGGASPSGASPSGASPGGASPEALYMGEGGSIPFMGLLGELFPEAQFMITGVLGPQSNAHGPNEFLDLPYAQKITMCVAHVLAAHFEAMKAGK